MRSLTFLDATKLDSATNPKVALPVAFAMLLMVGCASPYSAYGPGGYSPNGYGYPPSGGYPPTTPGNYPPRYSGTSPYPPAPSSLYSAPPASGDRGYGAPPRYPNPGPYDYLNPRQPPRSPSNGNYDDYGWRPVERERQQSSYGPGWDPYSAGPNTGPWSQSRRPPDLDRQPEYNRPYGEPFRAPGYRNTRYPF